MSTPSKSTLLLCKFAHDRANAINSAKKRAETIAKLGKESLANRPPSLSAPPPRR